MDESHVIGNLAEATALRLLREQGFECHSTPYRHPFDILAEGGLRIEVKGGFLRKDGTWKINLHHQSVLKEYQRDAYLILLGDVQGGNFPIFCLIFRAPLKVKTLYFSFRSITKKHLGALDNWRLLLEIRREQMDIEASANKGDL